MADIPRLTFTIEGMKLMQVDAKEFFDVTWAALADAGWCDDIGGMEYQRVLKEWLSLAVPPDVTEFIKRRANIGPDGV